MVSDVGGGWMACESDHAISNIFLRWMIQELVAAGHHDLFQDHPDGQQFFPGITIPEPSLLSQQSYINFSAALDINDLKQV
jgi:hypothetical protein